MTGVLAEFRYLLNDDGDDGDDGDDSELTPKKTGIRQKSSKLDYLVGMLRGIMTKRNAGSRKKTKRRRVKSTHRRHRRHRKSTRRHRRKY